jgi:Glycosyl hydrolase family 46.
MKSFQANLSSLLTFLLLTGLVGCGASGSPQGSADQNPILSAPTSSPSSVSSDGWLTSEQKYRAEQITSLFENDTVELQYGYAENIQDGRGITAGRAGFTTATGDAYTVVQLYTEKSPNNELAKYLPRLKELAELGSDELSGLSGFETAWAKAAQDAVFRSSQDEIVDREYYRPAMEFGDKLGLKTALARAVLYDTIIQHGGGEDPDGLPALIARTEKKVGGSPQSGVDEKLWLSAFLKVRRATLENASDPATRAAWAESTYRVDVLEYIAASGNYDLHGPIPIKVAWFDVTLP